MHDLKKQQQQNKQSCMCSTKSEMWQIKSPTPGTRAVRWEYILVGTSQDTKHTHFQPTFTPRHVFGWGKTEPGENSHEEKHKKLRKESHLSYRIELRTLKAASPTAPLDRAKISNQQISIRQNNHSRGWVCMYSTKTALLITNYILRMSRYWKQWVFKRMGIFSAWSCWKTNKQADR